MRAKLVLFTILFLSVSAYSQENGSIRLSVQDCIDLALKNNAELRNSQLEIEKAKETKKEALTAYLPTVKAQVLAFDALNPMFSFGIDDFENALIRQILSSLYAQYGAFLNLQTEYSYVQNGVMLSTTAIEPVYVGGRVRNGNKLAQLGIEAAETQTKVKENEVSLQTESLYWQIIALQEKTTTLDQLDQLLDTLSKDLAGAVEAGLAMPTDQFKVALKQNESQLNRKKLDNGILLLKMALAQLIGIGWENMILTDTLHLEASPNTWYQPTEEAVANRNESHLLELSLRAEDLKKKMTLGEAMPSLMVGGSTSYQTVLKNSKPNATIFAILQVPITDWHKTYLRLKKHDLDTEEAENTRQDLTEKMQLQTNQAWFNLEQSWLRINMAQTAMHDAEANLKITKDYYEAGLVTVSDLLEAQTLLKQSRDELTDSRAEYRINLVTYRQMTSAR